MNQTNGELAEQGRPVLGPEILSQPAHQHLPPGLDIVCKSAHLLETGGVCRSVRTSDGLSSRRMVHSSGFGGLDPQVRPQSSKRRAKAQIGRGAQVPGNREAEYHQLCTCKAQGPEGRGERKG